MHVFLRDGESQESLLERFTKGVKRSGVLSEVRARRHFRSKSELAREAARKAARRRWRRAQRAGARASERR